MNPTAIFYYLKNVCVEIENNSHWILLLYCSLNTTQAENNDKHVEISVSFSWCMHVGKTLYGCSIKLSIAYNSNRCRSFVDLLYVKLFFPVHDVTML